MSFEDFQASRQTMSAKAFGEIVGDQQWDCDADTEFLVYDQCWWIEILKDGRHLLVLENMNWITGEDGTLEDLERKLYEFAQEG